MQGLHVYSLFQLVVYNIPPRSTYTKRGHIVKWCHILSPYCIDLEYSLAQRAPCGTTWRRGMGRNFRGSYRHSC